MKYIIKMANQHLVFTHIHFDRRVRQGSYRHGCRTLRSVSYILFEIILVLFARSASAGLPVTWNKGKDEESHGRTDGKGVGRGQAQIDERLGNLGMWDPVKIRDGETKVNLQGALGRPDTAVRMQGLGTVYPSVNGSFATQKKSQSHLSPTPWRQPSSHVPASTSKEDPLGVRWATVREPLLDGNTGHDHSLRRTPANARGGQRFFLSPERVRDHHVVTLERPGSGRVGSWRYTPGIPRKLPPLRGRKSLAAAALLYLMGCMSTPLALSMAGLGIFKMIRSQAKREQALLEALKKAEKGDVLNLYSFP